MVCVINTHNIFTMVKDVSNAIHKSTKRKKMYENILLELGSIQQNLLPFCPTRMFVRVKS